jgi:hypothetical protein
LKVGTEAPDQNTLGQHAAGLLSAIGTDRPMEPILVDDRLDPGKFSDLKETLLVALA